MRGRSSGLLGAKITHDIKIGDQLAFSNGEQVQIEKVDPDPNRPEYQYVILSKSLGKRFRLSDGDISVLTPAESND